MIRPVPRPPVSPVRRIAMQGVMWVILAAAVATAALVDGRGELGPTRTVGPITVRLPGGWEPVRLPIVGPSGGPSGGREVLVKVREESGGARTGIRPLNGRSLDVAVRRFATAEAAGRALAAMASDTVATVTANGLEWTVYPAYQLRSAGGAPVQVLAGWSAATATRGGRLVEVNLMTPGGATGGAAEADPALLLRVVESVRVAE